MPNLWAGILRVLQQPMKVTLLFKANGIRQNTGTHPCNGIRQNQRRKFSAGQNIVADGDLLIYHGVQNSLIDTQVLLVQGLCNLLTLAIRN